MAAVPSGSYLVLSHVTGDEVTAEASVVARSRDELAGLFGGLEIIEPGLVDGGRWRAEPAVAASSRTLIYGAVARKP
jgi:hypothetical protein